MELVKGIPITQFCDERRLTPRERLDLFIPICQAVQHAHQKGVIHRDLKPSNVLVALYDGRPVPKIIDFGVAKATGPRLTERTLFTEFGTIVGTPEYMSPEQAELNQLDVDTRSDIYGLGVLLYELLTGTTPLERKRLGRVALLEVMRLIREEEPPRPSTRLSTAEELPSIAANRSVEPLKLSGLMRGELDWIVMKCLEKDRDRRYETATGLARDLERHLHDEPVAAGPPSSGYRLRKFARRNRKILATVAVVATALVVGTALSTWQAVRATRAEGLAETRLDAERSARREAVQLLGEVKQQRNRADLARQQADRRATEANEVVDFLIVDMIGAAAPSRSEGTIPTVAQVLARADESIALRFAGRPLIEASIRLALARAYEELGQYKKGEQHAARAAEHAETIAAQNALGWAFLRQRRFAEARTLLEPVLETARRALGPEHEETLRVMHSLASALGALDEQAALRLREELVAVSKRVQGPEHSGTLAAMHGLAMGLAEVDPERAAKLYEEALAIQLRDRPNHPNTLITMSNLANHYRLNKKPDLALDLRLRCLEAQMRVLGVEHVFTRGSVIDYCSYLQQGASSQRLERARTILEQGLERARREFGPNSMVTVAWADSLAIVLVLLGRPEEAVALVDGLPEDREPLDDTALRHRACLARLLREHGRLIQARRLLEGIRAETLRLGAEAPEARREILEARGIVQLLLDQWPGLAPGIRPEDRPPAPFMIEAPFRSASPVADGQIAPDEYGPGVEARFDDDVNPGRMYARFGYKSHSKTPDDLSVRVHAAYTDRSLFLAFQVRDQFVYAGEENKTGPHLNDSIDVFINGDQVANEMTFVYNVNPIGNREGFQIIADAGGHQATPPESFTNADWKVGTSRTADGYIVEFEIPLDMIDTQDGPETVPATSGSELRVNFGLNDADDPQHSQTAYGIFWAEDPRVPPRGGGEDFWTVKLRLVPDPTSDSPPADGRR